MSIPMVFSFNLPNNTDYSHVMFLLCNIVTRRQLYRFRILEMSVLGICGLLYPASWYIYHWNNGLYTSPCQYFTFQALIQHQRKQLNDEESAQNAGNKKKNSKTPKQAQTQAKS